MQELQQHMQGFSVYPNAADASAMIRADRVLSMALASAGGPPATPEEATRDHGWVQQKRLVEQTDALLDLWNDNVSVRSKLKLPIVKRCQVAFRFAGERTNPESGTAPCDWFERHVHVDNPKDEQLSVVVGVVLSNHTRAFMGNFTVFPGAHAYVKAERPKMGKLSKKNMAPILELLQKHQNTLVPKQLRLHRGDIVVVDRWMPHLVAPNTSQVVRRIVWFRVRTSDGDDGHNKKRRQAGRCCGCKQPITDQLTKKDDE